LIAPIKEPTIAPGTIPEAPPNTAFCFAVKERIPGGLSP